MTVLLVIAAVVVLWTLVAMLCLALCRSAAAGDRSSPYLAALASPPADFVAVHDPVPASEEADAGHRRPPERAALASLDGGQSIEGGEVPGMAELEQALTARRFRASRSSSP